MESKIEKLIIGETLKSEEISNEKFNVFWGLPILSSDAISSVAYAGEEILWMLIFVIGLASYKYMFYASLCIVILLFILVFSYTQTIDSYPNGGGSYIVASDNLGTIPGLCAGAALSIDYILTVSVSVSSGVAAIVSAAPSLLPYRAIIAVGIIVLMTIGNLRGIRDSSRLFGIPTYLFLVCTAIMIITGLIKVYVFHIVPVNGQFQVPQITGSITLFLFLKAFASGCTALTGVEAVSNGIPNFKEPAQKNAKKVLYLLAFVVLFIFGGISLLATKYHAVPNHEVTVLSQIATQVFGNGSFLFYAVQVTTAFILIMAANTAYADLPLLLSLIAKDGYAPRQFTKRGKRLSFSNGIIVLCIASSILVLIFKGDTHALLPLYAVGVFMSFTLSQTGMFVKWVKTKDKGWKHKAFINGFGALVTLVTVIIIGITKFKHGAWIVCILIPLFVMIMLRIKNHYNTIAGQLRLSLEEKPKDISYVKQKQYVIVPIDSLNKSFLKAFNYARSISDNVIVFHVSNDEETTKKLKERWDEYGTGVPIVIKKTPYRDLLEPLVKYINSEEYVKGPSDMVTVVLPQFVVTKWWHYILHNQTSIFIRSALMKKRNIAIITVPYIIEE